MTDEENKLKDNSNSKPFFKLASFGKRMEYLIIAQMLEEGLDIYLPMVDDKGIDCIIRRIDGSFAEIQIKSRSNDIDPKMAALYAGIECRPRRDYWYVFWAAGVGKNGTMWIMNSFEFIYYASKNKKGKHIGKYTIQLSGAKKNNSNKVDAYPRKNMEKFISKDFSRIIENRLLIDNNVDYDNINLIRNNPWNLYKARPIVLYHPADRKILVSISKIQDKNKSGLQIWNLAYIADMNMGGIPGYAHENIVLENIKMKWHPELNQWHVWTKSKSDWIYKFALPSQEDIKYWNEIKEYVPSLEELQKKPTDLSTSKKD